LTRRYQAAKRRYASRAIDAAAREFEIESVPGAASEQSAVDLFWATNTVAVRDIRSVSDSLDQLDWRFSIYPKFREFSGLYEKYTGQTILDYGCGPGNDVVGFAVHTRVPRLIGIDISLKALHVTARRLALHQIDPRRIRLIHISDMQPAIPLEDNSVTHVNCQGVLHHSSFPGSILNEFHRVLVPDGTACIMVYNRDSLWFHLYTAYEKMIVEEKFGDLTLDEAFAKNTDGAGCPESRCYRPSDFVALCEGTGFSDIHYAGGYLSETELRTLHHYGDKALASSTLDDEHKSFLKELQFDRRGLPRYRGKHAGIGGTYHLRKT
jgi:ubiquinone/menaquinone biosynthesis C-methylase UbiE